MFYIWKLMHHIQFRAEHNAVLLYIGVKVLKRPVPSTNRLVFGNLKFLKCLGFHIINCFQ